jgi:hypothetical protein
MCRTAFACEKVLILANPGKLKRPKMKVNANKILRQASLTVLKRGSRACDWFGQQCADRICKKKLVKRVKSQSVLQFKNSPGTWQKH